MADEDSGIKTMLKQDFDPAQSALVADHEGNSTPDQGTGVVKFLSYQPERLTLQVETDKLALLVITDSDYPGWKATIDDQITPIIRTNILFRGIKVPEGQHLVVLTFEPWTVLVGRIISLIGFAAWIVLIIIHIRTETNKK
jgi:uncharacterized membrane protein YfhO